MSCELVIFNIWSITTEFLLLVSTQLLFYPYNQSVSYHAISSVQCSTAAFYQILIYDVNNMPRHSIMIKYLHHQQLIKQVELCNWVDIWQHGKYSNIIYEIVLNSLHFVCFRSQIVFINEPFDIKTLLVSMATELLLASAAVQHSSGHSRIPDWNNIH